MRFRAIAIFLCVLSLSTAAWAQSDPAPAAPAAAPDVAPFVKAVREAMTIDAAVVAYEKGSAIDGKNVDLLDAYLRKMLKFGLIHKAYPPADTLRSVQTSNVLALSTSGYRFAADSNLLAALDVYIQAMRLEPKDPSIQTNLGQLMAWADLDSRAAGVPAAFKEYLASLKNEPVFKQAGKLSIAYQNAKRSYDKRTTIQDKYAPRMDEVEKRVEAAKEKLIAKQKIYNEQAKKTSPYTSELSKLKSRASSIRSQGRREENNYRSTRDRVYSDREDRDRYRREIERHNRSVRKRVESLKKELQEVEKKIKELEAKAASEKKALEAVKQDRNLASLAMTKEKDALKKLHFAMETEMRAIGANWEWALPTVDGVPVTVATSVFTSKLVASPEMEAEATKELRKAEMYINSEMYDKARQILGTLAELYGTTDAGRTAKKLLTNLPDQVKPE